MNTVTSDFDLDALIERLRAVGGEAEEVMPLLALETRRFLLAAYARGQTPDGERWQLTQKGQPPKLTGKTLQVAVNGNVVTARLRFIEALHSLGQARGGVQRRMLPRGEMPPALSVRFERIIDQHMQLIIGG